MPGSWKSSFNDKQQDFVLVDSMESQAAKVGTSLLHANNGRQARPEPKKPS